MAFVALAFIGIVLALVLWGNGHGEGRDHLPIELPPACTCPDAQLIGRRWYTRRRPDCPIHGRPNFYS